MTAAPRDRAGDDPSRAGAGAPFPGVVVANFGAALAIEDDAGRTHRCIARRSLGGVVCGDRVQWHQPRTGDAVVTAVAPRRSVLARPDRRGREKPLAANFDRLLIVASPRPPVQPSLLDRYLVLAERIGIEALPIFHKADLEAAASDSFLALQAEYRDLGYQVVRTSSRGDPGLAPITAALGTATGILVGPSGAGKSSIVAALVPAREVRIGALSEASGLGRHTTTVATLYHLDGGGALIDSPGIRDFPLDNFTARDIADGFREFAEPARHCRFADCLHVHEPGCAVRAALGEGIGQRRWESYQQILASVEDPRERR